MVPWWTGDGEDERCGKKHDDVVGDVGGLHDMAF
jgi:hypothetical protein